VGCAGPGSLFDSSKNRFSGRPWRMISIKLASKRCWRLRSKTTLWHLRAKRRRRAYCCRSSGRRKSSNLLVVTFSGPLFQSNPQLMLDSIQFVIRQRAREKAANEVQLTVSTLGADAPALGGGTPQPQDRLESYRLRRLDPFVVWHGFSPKSRAMVFLVCA
jgi:hypothetical protein